MRQTPRVLLTVLVLVALGCASGARAALVTVGSNAETCDYTSLAFAIAFANSGDALVVEGKTWTWISGVNFNLLDKSLTITGGFDGNCTLTQTPNPTVLQGLGSDTVLTIDSSTPANVTLNNLVIQGGDGIDGGGVSIIGEVSVVMTNTVVHDNVAEFGAGIYIDALGPARLTLGAGSRVENNIASDAGGGIYCALFGTLDIQPDVRITGNQAVVGGGLYIQDCSLTMTASGADAVLIGENVATDDGGGLYISAGTTEVEGDGGSLSQLIIYDNEAAYGGGILIAGSPVAVRLTRASIAGNRADNGGGVYVSGGDFFLDAPADGDCYFKPCNALVNNGSFPGVTLGGAFYALNGTIGLESTLIERNTGQQPIGRLELASDLTMEGVAIADNTSLSGTRGVFVDSDATATLRGVTFADQVGISTLFGGFGSVDVDSMIAAGAPSDLFDPNLTWDLDCAVLTAGLPGGPHPQTSGILVTADPGFVDPAGGDFHVLPSSPAVDFCNDLGPGVDMDVEGRPQGTGWDAGADETETPIFADDFESGDLSAWSSST